MPSSTTCATPCTTTCWHMDLDNLNRMPTGQLVARANSDSTLVQGLLAFFPIMSGNVLLLLLSLAVMFYLSPLLALVSAGRGPGRAVRLLPDALAGLPRHLGRPAARGRRRPDRRRRRQRGAGREGVRPGAPRARTRRRGGQTALRLPDAGRPHPGPLPAAARGHPGARAGGRSWPSAATWPCDHHITHRDVPRLLHLRGPVRGARPHAGRRAHRGPAGPGRRRADLPALDLQPAIADAPDAVELGRLAGDIDFDDVSLRLSRRAAGAARLRPAHRRRASGSPWSGRAAAASRPWP